MKNIAGLLFVLALLAQDADIKIPIIKSGERPAIAVIDFRGSPGAQAAMGPFNESLFGDLQTSGLFKMVPKSVYPLENPQRPEDFQPTSGKGLAMADWSGPPAKANYLAFGYTAVQNKQLVLYGWLYDLRQGTLQSAQVIGKRYFGSVDEAGARKVAHEFAADIIAQFGGGTLLGSRIYFVSDRTGHKEIWSMDYDGSNQQQITRFNSISIMPSVSPDGAKLAFTSFAKGQPRIMLWSTETNRQLAFYNQQASLNETATFTPDGKRIYYSSSASGYAQIYVANLDGSGLRRISTTRAIEVEPKVNPKTGNELVFVSGRSGPQQIFRMNTDGADVERLTNGEGEAANPSWHPDGQHILYAWTRGYAKGEFNVFLMDVASRQFDQLTFGAGKNENPNWAPDGRHLVFTSTRTGKPQLWTMLADGTQLQQLTTQGGNQFGVWGK
ncbi:MAG: DPP IV N-terminal domain-containing protein [Bryobacteraceae bacterium]